RESGAAAARIRVEGSLMWISRPRTTPNRQEALLRRRCDRGASGRHCHLDLQRRSRRQVRRITRPRTGNAHREGSMPAIQTELRVQVEGGRILLPPRQTTLNVDSYEQLSFTVPGVPPAPPVKPGAANTKAAKKPPRPQVHEMRPHVTLSNAKFVAIYNGGQGAGLKIKVGGDKLAPLTQPLVYMDRAAA